MDFTVEISKAFGLSPFHVLNQDKDNVIMMINYYIEKGDNMPAEKPQMHMNEFGQRNNGRVRVNDRTATGGWF